MALSKKLTQILKSKTDLTEKEIESLTEQKGWGIVYSMSPKKELKTEICFTGFNPSKKEDLIEIAKNNNFKVVKSVTVNLNFLCFGNNAGQSKIEKATSNGSIIINENQFLNLINTGEIPN